MTTELVLSNARVVLRDEVRHAAVLVRNGLVADIGDTQLPSAHDLDGDYVLPGIVELHTDHAEYHLNPRPGVRWEALPAVLAHDAQMTAAGATTVLDAVRLGSADEEASIAEAVAELLSVIDSAATAGLFRADHALHLRCEVSAADCHEQFERYADNPRIRLVSLMDHTPGQRQFESLEQYKLYYVGKGLVPEHEFEAFIDSRMAQGERNSERNRKGVAAAARERGLSLAAHDDATPEHVAESLADGARIAEFPTTVAAAEASVAHGMSVVMGAPNMVRGGSHSGNVAAETLLDRGLLHILSSDYVPSSPLQAVFGLVSRGKIDLPEAVALVSTNPARSVGLDDRGEIAPGQRADLVRVHAHPTPVSQNPASIGVPVVRSVFRQGARVA
ncbi:MAG: alpha-D-ribose 1-methylphosphonate 5-triphosphate diphosphatase [Dermatophilus congolensis]|nr:alpha-D-ribose 1-methylphosphonate 5-triphosphate diphosphatase [Dermatophilus congolensis]